MHPTIFQIQLLSGLVTKIAREQSKSKTGLCFPIRYSNNHHSLYDIAGAHGKERKSIISKLGSSQSSRCYQIRSPITGFNLTNSVPDKEYEGTTFPFYAHIAKVPGLLMHLTPQSRLQQYVSFEKL